MKSILISLLFIFSSSSLFAQESLFGMTYQMALPIGTTSDYISTFSGRGFGLDYKGFVTPEVAVGGLVGWNVFYEEIETETYLANGGNSAITGKQWRYMNTFPILLTADYFFGGYGMPRAFIGGGLGTYRVYQRTDMGIFTVEPREWMFGFAPEVGALVPVGNGAQFMASARFNYAFAAGDIDALSYLGFNLGFVWN